MHSALNVIWKAKPRGTTVSRLIRARAASLGLVAALGFLLAVSLAVSAMLAAFGSYLNSVLPFGKLILSALNVVISLALLSILFAAIYKVLPDRDPMARRLARIGHYSGAVHHRKNAYWLVYRKQCNCIELRRCRRANCPVVMDILFGTDFLAGRGDYQVLCEPSGQQTTNSSQLTIAL
jgi:virulence factor BrkB